MFKYASLDQICKTDQGIFRERGIMKLFEHQEIAKKIACEQNHLGLFWEMGTGKTRTAIEIISDRFKEFKRPHKVLILCPQICVENWADEFEKWVGFTRDNMVMTLGKSAKRLEKFEEEKQTKLIAVTNYESLRTKKFLDALMAWGPEIIVLDESHRVKNPKAAITKAVLKLSDLAEYRYALTGTVMTNSPLDLFSQALFLDKGKQFGRNFFVFRTLFMQDTNEYKRGVPGYFPNWKPRKRMFQTLTDGLSAIGTRVVKDEVLDLPPLIKQRYVVELSSKQRRYYEDMQDHAVTMLEEAESSGAAVGPIAITQTLRMQQIVSGFVVDENKNIIEIDPKKNNRLKACKELAEDVLAQGEKVIIWTCFKYDVQLLKKEFKKYDPSIIDGSTKDKDEQLKRFRDPEGTNVIIANRKAGGIGINLVEAKYSIVYSRNHSLEDELQSEARNFRRGSECHDKIVKIDLCAKDTLDEEILKALTNKDNMVKAIVDIIKRR